MSHDRGESLGARPSVEAQLVCEIGEQSHCDSEAPDAHPQRPGGPTAYEFAGAVCAWNNHTHPVLVLALRIRPQSSVDDDQGGGKYEEESDGTSVESDANARFVP